MRCEIFGLSGIDEADATFPNELPGDLALAPIEHFDELTFRPPAPIQTVDADRNAVAVEQGPHFARRQVDIIACAIVTHDEAKAIAMPADDARHEIELCRQAILAPAILE